MNPVTNEKAPAAANSAGPEDRNESAIVPTTQQDRKLLPVQAENIPDELKRRARWACWRAIWNPKGHGGKGKWDKVPVHPSGYGLSTRRPDGWAHLALALAAYRANPKGLAGVGYLMTGDAGVVGIDLDRCVDGNEIAPWAQELLAKASTYTERSPSGTGLRLFMRGTIAADWTKHEVGIEVYAGHTARFLTVTGQRLEHCPETVNDAPAGFLEDLASRYSTKKDASTAPQDMPDLVDDLLLPDMLALDLPYATTDFLRDGTTGADRSRSLFTAAVDLFAAGLDDATVLSVLASNPHAMGIALDHRRQDHDRALMYLWVEHTQKARGRATSRVASADDFEDVSGSKPTEEKPARKAGRFAPVSLAELLARPRPKWTIKRVLPDKGVGMVFGPSRSGKSFFVLDMALAITRGVEWRGSRVRQGAVAYVVAEGMGGFAGRVQAYAEYHGCEGELGPLHIIPAAPNLLDKGDTVELTQELRALGGLRVVIVDTLAQTTPGADENSSQDMGRAMAHCQRLADATGALVLLVGHTGKDESRGPRGWSGMAASFDTAIQLERSGDFRTATMLKVKDGEGEGEEYPFHLSSVVLGKDEDGEDITSMVVLPGNAAGAVKLRNAPKLRGAVQKMLWAKAQTLLDLGGPLSEQDLVKAVVAEQSGPEPEKRDYRVANTVAALAKMVAAGHLWRVGHCIQLHPPERIAEPNKAPA